LIVTPENPFDCELSFGWALLIHNGALADLVESFKRTVLRLKIARLQTAENCVPYS